MRFVPLNVIVSVVGGALCLSASGCITWIACNSCADYAGCVLANICTNKSATI